MTLTARPQPSPRRIPIRHDRLAAAGVVGGGGFLLSRTIVLIAGGSLATMVWWAAALLVVELTIDVAVVTAGVRWLISRRPEHGVTALRAVAAMILAHALRVAVFVLGRTGPWVDFDVRPTYRADHAKTWTWTGVWIAGVGAALSVVALLVVFRLRSRRRRRG